MPDFPAQTNTVITPIVATAAEARSKMSAQAIRQNNPVLYKIEKNNHREFPGGQLIRERVTLTETANAGAYSGFDRLAVGADRGHTAADFKIKFHYANVVISGEEQILTAGPNSQDNLIDLELTRALTTLKNNVSAGIYSTGAGKEITGLQNMVTAVAAGTVAGRKASGSYGGIPRANWANWRELASSYAANSPTTSANIQDRFRQLIHRLVRDSEGVNCIVVDTAFYILFVNSFAANERFQNTEMAKAGFKSVTFEGVEIINGGGVGGDAPSGIAFLLNTMHMNFYTVKGRNFQTSEQKVATNQDAVVVPIYWAGNMTCSDLRMQGRIDQAS